MVIGRSHFLTDWWPQVSISLYMSCSVAAWLFSQHVRWCAPNWVMRERERERRYMHRSHSLLYSNLGNGLPSFLPYATGHRNQNKCILEEVFTRVGMQMGAMLEAVYYSVTIGFGRLNIFYTSLYPRLHFRIVWSSVFTQDDHYTILKCNPVDAQIHCENILYLWKGFCE